MLPLHFRGLLHQEITVSTLHRVLFNSAHLLSLYSMVYLLFKGARFDFLVEQLAEYDAAVASGTTKEFLDTVYARFARRFPINLPLDEDPSAEFLASVDDSAPEPENEVNFDELSPEELEVETKKLLDRQVLIQKRRKVRHICF